MYIISEFKGDIAKFIEWEVITQLSQSMIKPRNFLNNYGTYVLGY